MSVRFIQLADTQLGLFADLSAKDGDPFSPDRMARMREAGLFPADQPLNSAPRGYSTLEPDIDRFTAALNVANELSPDFVMVCGDLVNDPRESAQHDGYRSVAGTLDDSIPLRWVPGNHDVSPDTLTPTPEFLSEYRGRYGDDYYAFSVNDTFFLALNSELLSRPENVPEDARRQFDFIEAELASRPARDAGHIIAFMHTPLFVRDAETDRLGVVRHEGRKRTLELFREGAVDLVLAGHLHHNLEARSGDIEMVTSGSVGFPFAGQSGYRVVDVSADAIKHEYHSLGFTL